MERKSNALERERDRRVKRHRIILSENSALERIGEEKERDGDARDVGTEREPAMPDGNQQRKLPQDNEPEIGQRLHSA